MKIDFSSPVIRHCFSLRCLPFDTPSQRIELINVDIEPHNMLTETADGFGNRVLTDRIIEPHSKFVAIVEGKASLDFSKREKEELNCIYKYPSQHTVPGEKIIELVSGLGDMANLTALETAQAVSKRIGEVFSYKSGVTNINTTAEEALHLGCGVCQDYAHIFFIGGKTFGRSGKICCRHTKKEPVKRTPGQSFTTTEYGSELTRRITECAMKRTLR